MQEAVPRPSRSGYGAGSSWSSGPYQRNPQRPLRRLIPGGFRVGILDHSLAEIAALLEMSTPAVKAAVHRGRSRLRELSAARELPAPRSGSPTVARYAALFNARDWDGVRAMLVDDVRLDLASRERRAGLANVRHYFINYDKVHFINYDKVHDWRLVPGWLDGREVLAVFRSRGEARPGYFIELTLRGERVAAIRDFCYVSYIGQDTEIVLTQGATP